MINSQFLILQSNAYQAQVDILNRRFGLEVFDEETQGYVKPFFTQNLFQVIEHPETDFVAIVVPEKTPMGMKFGEDWTRGKPRDYNGEPVTGRPSQDETIDRLWISNKPLKDYAYMVANGWFPDNE